ncbi:MAG: DUF2971 domain-containing protein [Clostridia bacterium]|nr:DUF2971 domain-containing protein [Clostridia bacterium]
MSNINDINYDSWKEELISELITSIIGTNIQKQKAYEEVGRYYMCYAPISLYKYYSDQQLDWNTVENNKMWYSAACNFNDVFDCDIYIDEEKILNSMLLIATNNKGARRGSQIWLQLKQALSKELPSLEETLNSLKSTMGISCLSEINDSLLMWAHYANNHKGICVEYNLMEINKKLGFSPVPIIYSENKVAFNTFSQDFSDDDATTVLIKSITSKSPEWSYEKEWRIIRDNAACGNNWNDVTKGALLDMIQPSSIILGCMATPEFENVVHEHCKANHINLYKMEKDKSCYNLTKKTIFEFKK